MAKLKPEGTRPSNYFSDVKAAQDQEKPNVSSLISSLRTDMVPSSNTEPAKESVIKHENLKALVGIVLGLIILAFILLMLIGPGRPILEHNLALLANKAATPTLTASSTHIPPTQIPPTQTPFPPTSIPSPSPTIQPTKTPLIMNAATPTRITPTMTPTQPECRDVLSITLDDVGKSLCTRGVVLETIANPTDFMVIFSYERGAFYWVTYDLVWSSAEVKNCYQIRGTIDRIGNSPMLVFDYQNLPEVCP
jgi:hypothetical protein